MMDYCKATLPQTTKHRVHNQKLYTKTHQHVIGALAVVRFAGCLSSGPAVQLAAPVESNPELEVEPTVAAADAAADAAAAA